MKIQSQFRNVNLFNTSNINNSKNNISIKEQINIPEGNSIKVDISKEAIEKYRNVLAKNENKSEDIKECHILISHGYELSAKYNQINDDKKNLTVKKKADNLFKAYTSMYQEIVDGYEHGTRIVYSEENNDKILSKEEDLVKLNEAYENHVNTFEEMIHMEEKSDLLLEKELRGTAWGSTSSLAQEFLAKLDEKRANPEYIPNNIAERMINAGKTFQTNFSKLQNSNTKYGPSIN